MDKLSLRRMVIGGRKRQKKISSSNSKTEEKESEYIELNSSLMTQNYDNPFKSLDDIIYSIIGSTLVMNKKYNTKPVPASEALLSPFLKHLRNYRGRGSEEEEDEYVLADWRCYFVLLGLIQLYQDRDIKVLGEWLYELMKKQDKVDDERECGERYNMDDDKNDNNWLKDDIENCFFSLEENLLNIVCQSDDSATKMATKELLKLWYSQFSKIVDGKIETRPISPSSRSIRDYHLTSTEMSCFLLMHIFSDLISGDFTKIPFSLPSYFLIPDIEKSDEFMRESFSVLLRQLQTEEEFLTPTINCITYPFICSDNFKIKRWHSIYENEDWIDRKILPNQIIEATNGWMYMDITDGENLRLWGMVNLLQNVYRTLAAKQKEQLKSMKEPFLYPGRFSCKDFIPCKLVRRYDEEGKEMVYVKFYCDWQEFEFVRSMYSSEFNQLQEWDDISIYSIFSTMALMLFKIVAYTYNLEDIMFEIGKEKSISNEEEGEEYDREQKKKLLPRHFFLLIFLDFSQSRLLFIPPKMFCLRNPTEDSETFISKERAREIEKENCADRSMLTFFRVIGNSGVITDIAETTPFVVEKQEIINENIIIANARGFLSEIICKSKVDITPSQDAPTKLTRPINFENLPKNEDEYKRILYNMCKKKLRK